MHPSLRTHLDISTANVTGNDLDLLEIDADRPHGQGITAQQFKVVSNISGAATKFPAQLRHQERNIQNVNLVRQDVIFEAVLEDHDVVVSERAANQCRHDRPFGFKKGGHGA